MQKEIQNKIYSKLRFYEKGYQDLVSEIPP